MATLKCLGVNSTYHYCPPHTADQLFSELLCLQCCSSNNNVLLEFMKYFVTVKLYVILVRPLLSQNRVNRVPITWYFGNCSFYHAYLSGECCSHVLMIAHSCLKKCSCFWLACQSISVDHYSQEVKSNAGTDANNEGGRESYSSARAGFKGLGRAGESAK